MEATGATISCANLSSSTHQCKWSQRLRPSSELSRTVFFRNSFRSANGSHSRSLITRAAAKKKTRTKKATVAADEEKVAEIADSNQELQQQAQPPQPKITLDDVNPVGLGRKSRQLFDEVWRKFSGLGQISRTTRMDDKETLDALLIREGPMCEFAIPGAQNTTVLVVGATSRIGRIVVRKLMLRGYSVKVLLDLLIFMFFSALLHFSLPPSSVLNSLKVLHCIELIFHSEFWELRLLISVKQFFSGIFGWCFSKMVFEF